MHSDELIRRGTMTTGYRRLVWAVAMAAGLAAFAASGSTAAAQQYRAVDLYPFGSWLSATSASAGQVVGNYYDPENVQLTSAILVNRDGSGVNLTPVEHPAAWVVGTDGVYQFGRVRTNTYTQASWPAVWSGSAASVTYLPAPASSTAAWVVEGSGGGQFVGGLSGVTGGAMLWNGLTAEQPINLHPKKLRGISGSVAQGTNGAQQVGHGNAPDASGNPFHHALLWNGSADSAVDLHPTHLPGMTHSAAVATDGQQQVGAGSYGENPHALLWSGSADSAVDLNPAGFATSFAKDVSNGKQVGGADSHAMLWTGAAESAVDLHLLLPSSFQSSVAYSIDDAGHVFGVAFNSSDQRWHAIEWSPQAVPEPTSLALLGLGGIVLLRRRSHV